MIELTKTETKHHFICHLLLWSVILMSAVHCHINQGNNKVENLNCQRSRIVNNMFVVPQDNKARARFISRVSNGDTKINKLTCFDSVSDIHNTGRLVDAYASSQALDIHTFINTIVFLVTLLTSPTARTMLSRPDYVLSGACTYTQSKKCVNSVTSWLESPIRQTWQFRDSFLPGNVTWRQLSWRLNVHPIANPQATLPAPYCY